MDLVHSDSVFFDLCSFSRHPKCIFLRNRPCHVRFDVSDRGVDANAALQSGQVPKCTFLKVCGVDHHRESLRLSISVTAVRDR